MEREKELWERIAEKEREEKEIFELVSAVREERKTGFFGFLRDMFFGLGIKNVFYGAYDAVFVLLALSAALLLLLSVQTGDSIGEIGEELYGFVFAASPAAYIVFFLISFFKETLDDSFTVKMTCRYTVLHLSAFRMFMAGAFCLAVNAAAVAIIAGKTGTQLTELAAVSFSSLFLFALTAILSLLKLGKRGAVIPACLDLFFAALSAVPGCGSFFKGIPIAAYALLGFISLITYHKILTDIDRRYSYVVR